MPEMCLFEIKIMKIQNSNSDTRGQFEASENGKQAGKMTYKKEGDNKMIIDHTEVTPEFQGKGVGKDLVKFAAEYARDNDLKIIAECEYAKKIMEKSSNYDDVLA